MDILDWLAADHDSLRNLIIEFKIAEEESEQEAQAFTALVSIASAQGAARLQLFSDLASRSTELKNLTAPFIDRVQGALEVENMIECCTNRVTWRASVNIYCEMLETGMDQEAKALLPQLYDHFSSPQRRRMGSQYRLVRGFRGKLNWRTRWAQVLNYAV